VLPLAVGGRCRLDDFCRDVQLARRCGGYYFAVSFDDDVFAVDYHCFFFSLLIGQNAGRGLL
jgi:hypothetical protein